jgi:hypothetical protein
MSLFIDTLRALVHPLFLILMLSSGTTCYWKDWCKPGRSRPFFIYVEPDPIAINRIMAPFKIPNVGFWPYDHSISQNGIHFRNWAPTAQLHGTCFYSPNDSDTRSWLADVLPYGLWFNFTFCNPTIPAAWIAVRSRILFPRQIYSGSLQKHPFSASWTPKTSSPHHIHVRVGTYVQRLLLVER